MVASEITQAARLAAPDLSELPPARLRQAIEPVILGPSAAQGLQWLHDAGVLAVLLPELEATVDFSQEAGRRHKDVWEHTKQVVVQAPPAAARALGGAAARRRQGADARDAARRQGDLPPPRRGRRAHVRPDRAPPGLRTRRTAAHPALILHHLRANAYEPEWTDAAVRRFDHEMGEHLDDLLEPVARRRDLGRPGRRQEAARNIDALMERILAIRELDARVPPLPPGLGNAIMETLHSCRRRGGSASCASCARRPSSAASWSSGSRRLLRRLPARTGHHRLANALAQPSLARRRQSAGGLVGLPRRTLLSSPSRLRGERSPALLGEARGDRGLVSESEPSPRKMPGYGNPPRVPIKSRRRRRASPAGARAREGMGTLPGCPSDRVGVGGLRPPEPERGRAWAPSQGAHRQCLPLAKLAGLWDNQGGPGRRNTREPRQAWKGATVACRLGARDHCGFSPHALAVRGWKPRDTR